MTEVPAFDSPEAVVGTLIETLIQSATSLMLAYAFESEYQDVEKMLYVKEKLIPDILAGADSKRFPTPDAALAHLREQFLILGELLGMESSDDWS